MAMDVEEEDVETLVVNDDSRSVVVAVVAGYLTTK